MAYCINCRSPKVVSGLDIIEEGHLTGLALSYKVPRPGARIIKKKTKRPKIKARVCAACGEVQLYTEAAQEIYDDHIEMELLEENLS